MRAEFVKLLTGDSVINHGLFFEPSRDTGKGIAHVHGLAGNFYENEFIRVMAEAFTKENYSFLTFNNRGHDYISDIERDRDGGPAFFKGGGAYERFEESFYDLEAAMLFLSGRGVRRICLQGHSTGCNKLVNFLSRGGSGAGAAALLSPCDDIAMIRSGLKGKFDEGLALAKELASSGKGGELLPPELVFYPMSAATYLDYYSEGALHDIFRFRNPRSKFPGLGNLAIPVFASYGTEGEYLDIPAEEALRLIRESLPEPGGMTAKIIKGACHNYRGKEKELAGEILEFLAKSGF